LSGSGGRRFVDRGIDSDFEIVVIVVFEHHGPDACVRAGLQFVPG
jgi:hypothetical protein